MNKGMHGLCLIISMCCLTACATVASMDIQQSSWQLDTVTINESEQLVTGKFSIEFGESGVVSGNRLCNRWGGTYSQEGDLLIVKSTRMTRAFCQTSSQLEASLEQGFIPALNSGLELNEDGHLQAMAEDGAVWKFKRSSK